MQLDLPILLNLSVGLSVSRYSWCYSIAAIVYENKRHMYVCLHASMYLCVKSLVIEILSYIYIYIYIYIYTYIYIYLGYE